MKGNKGRANKKQKKKEKSGENTVKSHLKGANPRGP
jgi:hypothetical protein